MIHFVTILFLPVLVAAANAAQQAPACPFTEANYGPFAAADVKLIQDACGMCRMDLSYRTLLNIYKRIAYRLTDIARIGPNTALKRQQHAHLTCGQAYTLQ